MTNRKNWVHVNKNGGMGLEEQWILRAENAPVCSLRRCDDTIGPVMWSASLLNRTGISAVALHTPAATLGLAQVECEQELTKMGWTL